MRLRESRRDRARRNELRRKNPRPLEGRALLRRMERTNDGRPRGFDNHEGRMKRLHRGLRSGQNGRIRKREMELVGAAQSHQFFLSLQAARDVAERGVRRKGLCVQGVLRRLSDKWGPLPSAGLEHGAIFGRENLVALQIFRGVHVPGLGRVGLLARARFACRFGDILILRLLILVLLTRGLLFLGVPYRRSKDAEREEQETGQASAQRAREYA